MEQFFRKGLTTSEGIYYNYDIDLNTQGQIACYKVLEKNMKTFFALLFIVHLALASVIADPAPQSQDNLANISVVSAAPDSSTPTPKVIMGAPAQNSTNTTKGTNKSRQAHPKGANPQKPSKKTPKTDQNASYTYAMGLKPPASDQKKENQTKKHKPPQVIRTNTDPTKKSNKTDPSPPGIAQTCGQKCHGQTCEHKQNDQTCGHRQHAAKWNQTASVLYWECAHRNKGPKGLNPTKIIVNLHKQGMHILKFNLLVAGQQRLFSTARVHISVNGDTKMRLIRSEGVYQEQILFNGKKGINFIESRVDYQGRCTGLVYAVLTNIEIRRK